MPTARILERALSAGAAVLGRAASLLERGARALAPSQHGDGAGEIVRADDGQPDSAIGPPRAWLDRLAEAGIGYDGERFVPALDDTGGGNGGSGGSEEASAPEIREVPPPAADRSRHSPKAPTPPAVPVSTADAAQTGVGRAGTSSEDTPPKPVERPIAHGTQPSPVVRPVVEVAARAVAPRPSQQHPTIRSVRPSPPSVAPISVVHEPATDPRHATIAPPPLQKLAPSSEPSSPTDRDSGEIAAAHVERPAPNGPSFERSDSGNPRPRRAETDAVSVLPVRRECEAKKREDGPSGAPMAHRPFGMSAMRPPSVPDPGVGPPASKSASTTPATTHRATRSAQPPAVDMASGFGTRRWPELPEADHLLPADDAATILRGQRRLDRLDREQRGESWSESLF